MKNLGKYSFTILIMASCLILFAVVSVKVLIVEPLAKNAVEDGSPQQEQLDTSDEKEDSNVAIDDKNQNDANDSKLQTVKDSKNSDSQTGSKKSDEKKNGKKPEKPAVDPEAADFVTAEKSYLDDALFIGDSRTVGMKEYGKMSNASFFCDTCMSVYNIYDTKAKVKDIGTVSLKSLLKQKKYGKIYLMIGINELGYNQKNTIKKYKELAQWIHEQQPDALLFIEGNLHVAKERSDSDKYFNNKRINHFNRKVSELADNKEIFYIDVNEIFDDEDGNLKAECTSDNTHVLGKYYKDWRDWILTKAIEK